jgi:hypothetical protein
MITMFIRSIIVLIASAAIPASVCTAVLALWDETYRDL